MVSEGGCVAAPYLPSGTLCAVACMFAVILLPGQIMPCHAMPCTCQEGGGGGAAPSFAAQG